MTVAGMVFRGTFASNCVSPGTLVNAWRFIDVRQSRQTASHPGNDNRLASNRE